MADPSTLRGRVVSVTDFAKYLGRPDGKLAGTAIDENIALRQIEGAENIVEQAIPYDLEPATAETRTFAIHGDTLMWLPGGARNITAVQVDGSDVACWTPIARRGRPAHLIYGLPHWGQTLSITADWGFASVPSDLVDAILAIAARNHFQKLNGQADIVQSADGAASSFFDRLPTVATKAINSYEIPGC